MRRKRAILHQVGRWGALLLTMPILCSEGWLAEECPTLRSHVDRPDDSIEPQVHVVYVVPGDGRDRELDLDGTLCRSVTAANDWLSEQTSGMSLRFDTFEGQLDVTFVRLNQRSSVLTKEKRFLVRMLERILVARGLLVPHKIYAVYYEGESEGTCGGSNFPPSQPGQIAALYLRGTGTAGQSCDVGWSRTPAQPAYWDFVLLHGTFHALGFVPSCAPHYRPNGHVTDHPRDLMHFGSTEWIPQFLDYGHDDYFRHRHPRCPDLADSPFLVGQEAQHNPSPDWQRMRIESLRASNRRVLPE